MLSPIAIDPLVTLRHTGEEFPASLREQVLTLGATAIPSLVALVEDEEADSADAPGEGWPPIHAVELLIQLGATDAIEPLLRVLKSTTIDHVIHSKIVVGLPKLGQAVLETSLVRAAVARNTRSAAVVRRFNRGEVPLVHFGCLGASHTPACPRCNRAFWRMSDGPENFSSRAVPANLKYGIRPRRSTPLQCDPCNCAALRDDARVCGAPQRYRICKRRSRSAAGLSCASGGCTRRNWDQRR